VTFVIRGPFRFANIFLRKLLIDKVSSLRQIELKLAYSDIDATLFVSHSPRKTVLYNLIGVFETERELCCLNSLAPKLHLNGCVRQINGEPSLLFRPVNDDSSVPARARPGSELRLENWAGSTHDHDGSPICTCLRAWRDVYERVAPNQKYVKWRRQGGQTQAATPIVTANMNACKG
jgi:hypothetical protein